MGISHDLTAEDTEVSERTLWQGPINFSLSLPSTGKPEKKSDKLKFIGHLISEFLCENLSVSSAV